MNYKQSQMTFYCAALFNWAAALVFWAPLGLAAGLGLAPAPVGNIYEFIACAAIALFGLGYYWVARDPTRNRDLVKLGLLGKLVVVALAFGGLWSGAVNAVFALLVSGDLVFAILFMVFLRQSPSR